MGTNMSHCAGSPEEVKFEKGPQALSVSEEKTGISSENMSSDSDKSNGLLSPINIDLEPTESFQYLKRSRSTSEYSIRLNSPNSSEMDHTTVMNELLSLCESGNGSSVSFLLDNNEMLKEIINNYHECHVGDRQMNITPLMLAAACGHHQIVEELLLVPSVSVNSTSNDIYGQSALHIAVSLGQLKCVQVLIANMTVDVNARDTLEMTPLHVAAHGRFDEAIELLLDRCDIDCELQDSNGNNIFHIGALSTNVSAVKLIIKHAASVDFSEICRYGDHSFSENPSDVRRPAMGESLRRLTEALNNDGLNVKTILQQSVAGLKSPTMSTQMRSSGYLELCDDAHRCLVLYTRATYYPTVLTQRHRNHITVEEYSPQEDITTALSWSPRAVLRENGSYIKICSPLSH